jgi:hypothetical protein
LRYILKDGAGGASLDGSEPERWRRMRDSGSLVENLADAGLTPLLT